MEYRIITWEQFDRLFKVKPFKGRFSCYGTWNGLDMYELADSSKEAVDKMWDRLVVYQWAWGYRIR